MLHEQLNATIADMAAWPGCYVGLDGRTDRLMQLELNLRIIRQDTTAGVAHAHKTQVQQGAALAALQSVQCSGQTKYCSHCPAKTSAAAGRPLRGLDGKQRKAIVSSDCLCTRYIPCHTQCASKVQKQIMLGDEHQACAVCDSRTLRMNFVCAGESCQTWHTLCVTQCVVLYDYWMPKLQRHLPMYLKSTQCDEFGDVDVRPIEVNQLFQAGYLKLQSDNKFAEHAICISPFVRGDPGIQLMTAAVNHHCAAACDRYWTRLRSIGLFAHLRILRLLGSDCVQLRGTTVVVITSSECTALSPCASCNEYAAGQLKQLICVEDVVRTCGWCQRMTDSKPLVRCAHCGCKQHEQCVLGAFGQFSHVGPSCVLCGAHEFQKCDDVAAEAPNTLQNYYPYWLFLALFQHAHDISVIENVMFPLGILYCAKVGAFEKTARRRSNRYPRYLVNNSIANFWTIMQMLYRTITSDIVAEVVLRMVLFGDFFLSSPKGGYFVTSRIVDNVSTVFADLDQRTLRDDLPSELLHLSIKTSAFTDSQTELLMKCFLRCWDVRVFANNKCYRVTNVPMGEIPKDHVILPDASSFEVFTYLNAGNRSIRNWSRLTFEVVDEWDDEEIECLNFMRSVMQLNVKERGTYLNTNLIMNHYRKHGSGALAVLFCAQQLSAMEIVNTVDHFAPHITYNNQWMQLGLDQVKIQVASKTETRTQCRSRSVLQLKVLHPDMYSLKSGYFVNAVVHMPLELGVRCVNAVCEHSLAELIVMYKCDQQSLELTPTRLSQILKTPSLLATEHVAFDVKLRGLCELGERETVDEIIATSISLLDLGALCFVNDQVRVVQDNKTMLAVLLLQHCHRDHGKVRNTLLQLLDGVLLVWISLITQQNNDEGSPPRCAIFR